MNGNEQTNSGRKILTVSELTADLKALLEKSYPIIWITGEISNFRVPSSGHYYFTLKDAGAQVFSVMFKGQNRSLKFVPEDGMSITGFGRISVYPPRGSYQLIFEYLEPAGAGALQAAFEQLKKKLSAEGLFDAEHKRPLPFIPTRIAVISSPTGAVVHDIIRIIHRRFPDMPIDILPVKVQGDGAVEDIVTALRLANEQSEADVIIVARGGGSLEDLAAFNDEAVARTIFASEKPVVSAVGHETDFTIADFVSDLRAPTPSAAAELCVPVKTDLKYTLQVLTRRISSRMMRMVADERLKAEKLSRRLVHPRRRLDDMMLRLDDQSARLINAAKNQASIKKQQIMWLDGRLRAASPSRSVERGRERVERLQSRLETFMQSIIRLKRSRAEGLCARVAALDPKSVLKRGYSIVRRIPGQDVVTSTDQVEVGHCVEVIVSKGSMTCRVEEKPGEDNKE